MESIESGDIDMSVLDCILKDDILQGRSCLMLDLKAQTENIYTLTNEKIHNIAEALRVLPCQNVRVYSKISQRLVILMSVMYKYSYMLNISIEDLKTLLEYAPWGDLLDVIEKYGNGFRLHQLESEQLSYLCGVMMHEVSAEYHEKFHRENMDRLAEMRTDALLDFSRRMHNNILSNIVFSCFLDSSKPIEEHMGNTTDSLGDKLSDYYPFDVVYYVDEDKKIYGIVRTEFDYILSKRENPYNRREVPLSILTEIEKRNNMCRTMSLGRCQTIDKSLKSLISPKLTYEELIPRVRALSENGLPMPIFNDNRSPSDMLEVLASYYDENQLLMVQPENELEEEIVSQRPRLPTRPRQTRPIQNRPRSYHRPMQVQQSYRNEYISSDGSSTIVSNDEDDNLYHHTIVDSTHPLFSLLSNLTPVATN